MKVLFIGIVTELVINAAKSDGLIGSYVTIEDAAVDIGSICNAYNTTDVDFTVLLTHIGFEEDKRLAALLDPDWGVDLIIGGHSHTFLEEPVVVNGIPIVQAGTGTDQIGRFDIVVDTDKNCIDSYTWTPVPIDDETCPHDAYMEHVIRGYKETTDKKYGQLITRFARMHTHPSRIQETELGNLIADAMMESLGVDIMLQGSGSIRSEEMGPIVTLGTLTEVFPYDDALYRISVTGAQLKRMIKHMLREDAFAGHTEFYQFSRGLHVVYDRNTKEFEAFDFNGRPIEEEHVYTVGIQAYHFQNLKEFLDVTLEECEANAPSRTLSTSARDVLKEYLMKHSNLNTHVEGRLVVKFEE